MKTTTEMMTIVEARMAFVMPTMPKMSRRLVGEVLGEGGCGNTISPSTIGVVTFVCPK